MIGYILNYYGDTRELKGLKDKIKFIMRCILSPRMSYDYLSGLQKLTHETLYIKSVPEIVNKPFRPYLMKDLQGEKAAESVLYHYHYMDSLPLSFLRRIYSEKGLLLAKVTAENERYYLKLKADGQYNKEGDLSIMLLDSHQQRLAVCTFSIVDDNGKPALFIGGLQGAQPEIPHDMIKKATKQCYGIFPKKMVIHALRQLSLQLGIGTLFAVSNALHSYSHSRYKKRKQHKFQADYDQCWKELGGHLLQQGYYQLPIGSEQKALSQVSANKRAQYRRRYLMLEDIDKQLAKYKLHHKR